MLIFFQIYVPKIEVIGYVYINLSTKSFYQYNTFTDTAIPIKKFTQQDSIHIAGVWNFYYPKALHIPNTEIVEIMSDTLIDGIAYKRAGIGVASNDKSKKTATSYIAYFNCDKKALMFDIDKALSQQIGCPMVRRETLPGLGIQPTMQTMIEYIADTLTAGEIKIFDAWGEYAKVHPVIK